MSKAKKDNVVRMDVDEEKAERKKFNGLLKSEIEAAASAIRTQKQKAAEVSGTLSGKLEVFEKLGGHKSALKTAERVAGMEPSECADWKRAFDAYFEALGGNDQLDMFEKQKETEANAASVAQASKPQTAAEPAVH